MRKSIRYISAFVFWATILCSIAFFVAYLLPGDIPYKQSGCETASFGVICQNFPGAREVSIIWNLLLFPSLFVFFLPPTAIFNFSVISSETDNALEFLLLYSMLIIPYFLLATCYIVYIRHLISRFTKRKQETTYRPIR